MKKLVSIILSLTFILGLFTVNTFAYTRPEKDIVPLQTFESESDLSIWSVDSYTQRSISEETDAKKGKYMVAKFNGTGNTALKLTFPSAINNLADHVGIEFDIRIPDTYDSSKDRYLTFYLRDEGGNTITPLKVNIKDKRPVVIGHSTGYFSSCFGTGWAHVKLELDIPIDRARTVISGTRLIEGYSKIELQAGRTTYKWLCIGDGSGNSTAPSTVHLDNFRIYKLENSDVYGAGECFLNEEMNLPENGEGNWKPTSSQFVFVCDDGSATRNISCVTDDGDSNKYMRMNSGNVAKRTYFRRSVSATKMFDMVNIPSTGNYAEKSSTAILYQTKFRIDDVTKANTTTLTTTPYTADGSSVAGERYILAINPKAGIVTVGEGSDIKTYEGLKLSSKQWYTLNLFHNVQSGYLRAEIVDGSGNKQVFEGTEKNDKVDYGYIKLFGFNNSSEEHTVIDFDDLKVYSVAVSDAETFYTLSDFAADKTNGTVTATVNVSSDMANVTTGAAKLIIACYKDHELAKLKVADVIPTTGTKTFTLEGIEDGEEVKVMLWDAATNTIVPLYTPITK